MNIEEVREYTLSLSGVTEDQAFGEDILNFRLEGKIFVCLWLGGGRCDMKDGVSRIALKLSPDRNIELREQFSAVTPAFHWNKTHWSDVYYEEMDEAIVKGLIKESYQLIASKLPKAIRSKYAPKSSPEKLNALIFDQFQHGYYVTGEKVGKAWNAGKEWMKK